MKGKIPDYKLDEMMGYECIPEVVYHMRKKERLSYGRISRWLNGEDFEISEPTLTKLFNKRLGGDPLERKGYSMGGRKKRKHLKNGHVFNGEYNPAGERSSSRSFTKRKGGAFTK